MCMSPRYPSRSRSIPRMNTRSTNYPHKRSASSRSSSSPYLLAAEVSQTCISSHDKRGGKRGRKRRGGREEGPPTVWTTYFHRVRRIIYALVPVGTAAGRVTSCRSRWTGRREVAVAAPRRQAAGAEVSRRLLLGAKSSAGRQLGRDEEGVKALHL